MKNNKLTRSRAARLAAKQSKQEVAGQLLDGTEVLKSQEARAKIRRWSFEADVILVMNKSKNEETGETPAPTELPMRTIKLQAVSYSTAREARGDCKQHEMYLRATNPMFAQAKITVRAIPHETISNTTLQQIMGYRDMSMILDKALAMAIVEGEDVVAGKSLGVQFVQTPEVPAEGETPVKPARTLVTIKEDFYKRALVELQKDTKDENPSVGSGPAQSNGEAQASTEESETFADFRERITASSDGASGTEGQMQAN